jgi:hypothetical protein
MVACIRFGGSVHKRIHQGSILKRLKRGTSGNRVEVPRSFSIKEAKEEPCRSWLNDAPAMSLNLEIQGPPGANWRPPSSAIKEQRYVLP